MEIIRDIEPQPRGIYTGTFGWLTPGRQARFNVAIRTALIDRHHERASYGVGAGITWDSVGAEEYRECLDKAAVLSRTNRDFALIETMRWAPGHGYFMLTEHLARLQASAEYFDYPCTPERVEHYLQGLTENFTPTPQRVRLLLHADGRLEDTCLPLEAPPSTLLRLHFARDPVDSRDVRLFHKTTRREIYDRALLDAPDADEVVLWNERGEVTECCTANLVMEKNGALVTPPIRCGLLPGTYREFLVRRGLIKEGLISKGDLAGAARVYLVNAVRKWRRAVLLPD